MLCVANMVSARRPHSNAVVAIDNLKQDGQDCVPKSISLKGIEVIEGCDMCV